MHKTPLTLSIEAMFGVIPLAKADAAHFYRSNVDTLIDWYKWLEHNRHMEDSFVHILNTITANLSAVKVKWRPPVDNDDIMDFSVFLSPEHQAQFAHCPWRDGQ